MKVWIIVLLSFLLLFLLVMLVCTNKVKEKLTQSFRCKRCLKINNVLKKKCCYCNEMMPKGYVYKSTFLGRRNCKNDEGYFDLAITIKHVKTDRFIWVFLIILNIIAIIAVAIAFN